MRQPDKSFTPRETAPGIYKFQAVNLLPSRNGISQMKTAFPHAHLLTEPKLARLGYDTKQMIEETQAQRVTQPGGEAASRRGAIRQQTLEGIDQRNELNFREDAREIEEMVRAERQSMFSHGDADAMFGAGVYPNVTDQYGGMDRNPDRYENTFIRTESYRLEQHTNRPQRREQRKRERQERRRERQSPASRRTELEYSAMAHPF